MSLESSSTTAVLAVFSRHNNHFLKAEVAILTEDAG